MKRIFDFAVSIFVCALLAIPMFIIATCIKLTSTGPVLYWSNRVGKNNVLFKMPKFRTMRTDTPAVATHLLNQSFFLDMKIILQTALKVVLREGVTH